MSNPFIQILIMRKELYITCELYLIQRSNWHIKTKIPKDVILLVLRKNTMMFCDRYFLQTKATAIEPCVMNLVLILSFWMSIARHSQSTQNNKFAYLCNISRKTWGMKLIFCLHINKKFFHKMIASVTVSKARHVQSTQITRLQYLCNISKKTWKMKLLACRYTSKVSSD